MPGAAGKLGTVFARAGHDVIFSYSRTRKKLEHLAKDAGGQARSGTPADATRNADAVLLAVHWTRVDDVLAQAGALRDKVLLTCSLPMSKDDAHRSSNIPRRVRKPWRLKSGARIWYPPSVPYPARCCFPYSRDGESEHRPTWCTSGTTKKQSTAARLIRDVGFNAVDLARCQRPAIQNRTRCWLRNSPMTARTARN